MILFAVLPLPLSGELQRLYSCILLLCYCSFDPLYLQGNLDFPALQYVCTGFSTVELVPSPKLRFHEVCDPVLLSVNVAVNGIFPLWEIPKNHQPEGLVLVLRVELETVRRQSDYFLYSP